jgi:ribonuclease VapC
MVLDSSALVSILLEEEGHETLVQKANSANLVVVSAPVLLEAAMVLSARFRQDARPVIAGLLRRLDAEIVDFNEQHYQAAVDAFLQFGKGRHPAGLSFGDCLCYALCAVSGLPLLCKSNDFARTDIQCA